jgi:N-methylhydantoinase A
VRGPEIGVDTGGTFTDVVCRRPDGRLHVLKIPSTRHDPSVAVLEALRQLEAEHGVAPAAVSRFAHGTTVATNAVLERKGARVGLIATAGFRDVLEIGRQLRRRLYDPVMTPTTPVFLAPRRMRTEVPERVAADGAVLVPLDEAAVAEAADALAVRGAEAIGVCFLFSFRNPAHEIRAREIVAARHPGLAVSLSHEVDPAFREYERTAVTAFDAYLKPVVDRTLARLEEGLRRAGVPASPQVMQSRGGLAGAGVARLRPVRLFLSGPAAGVIGGRIVGRSAGAESLVTIDVGGTSADIALVARGKPLIRPEAVIDGYEVRVAMVDVTTLGAGGGSIARVDAGGGLRVGPQSAGAEPGPACYGRGGEEATATDASLLLGYLDPGFFAGGTMRLDPAAARRAVEERVARPLGLSLDAAALGVHRVLNAQMAEGIRRVSVRQGLDPRGFALLPLGGAGGLHATALARELGIGRVVVPRLPGVLSAAGLLAAATEHEVGAAAPMRLDAFDAGAVRAALAALDARAAALMRQDGAAGPVAALYAADLCYLGQSYTLEVPFDPDAPDLAARLRDGFLAAHEQAYGYAARDVPVRVVNLRTVHSAGGAETLPEMALPPAGRPVLKGRRRIVTEAAPEGVNAPVLDREAMPAGHRFAGPAIAEQSDTTTLVEPGWGAEVDPSGNLVLTRLA